MPVRSLRSPVLTWPDARAVDQAARRWARQVASARPEVRRIGYIGSYARGDWGVGSDLDLLVIVASADQPFGRRPTGWDLTDLPVPAEALIYTEDEWQSLDPRSRFHRTITQEVVWVYPG